MPSRGGSKPLGSFVFIVSAMFEVIPAIDLKGGKCVRLRQGDAARVTEYSGDPVAVALGWVQSGRTTALDLARRVKAAGVARVIYTDIARDGTLGGANFDETEGLARETGLRVIASGGVAGIDDVRELWRRRGSGIEGV